LIPALSVDDTVCAGRRPLELHGPERHDPGLDHEGLHHEGLHYQEWGAGDPVIALHPLALESTAFAGVAHALAGQGLRTLAVDLPGFGRTPAPDAPLTPARLAEPVLALARSLDRPPLLLGMSLGGRVALEAALTEPESFRGVVPVVPYLPWRRWRTAMGLVRWLDPSWGERLPLERAWPLLKLVAREIERIPDLEHDWLARASVRVVYYSSCPATRVAFLSATREMTLDPAFGPRGLWTRMKRLALPATFLWAGRDGLVPRSHIGDVRATLPAAHEIEVPCAGHFVNGAHFACMRHAIALAVARTLEACDAAAACGSGRGASTLAPCLAGARAPRDESPAEDPAPAAGATVGPS
jgi:pimeloyl-ACP methyl ester carboxylesterase